jgi:hypothetical protein
MNSRSFGIVVLALLLLVSAAHAWAAAAPSCNGDARAFARTDLFFGRARVDGAVTDAQFDDFVRSEVTPRFPAGLTLLAGIGQFRNAGGTTQVEGANVLILLYPLRDAQADRKIDAIRSGYRRRFEQQSVLRADSVSCVSF